MASTTRSGTKYNRSEIGQQQKIASVAAIQLKLDLGSDTAGFGQLIQHDSQVLEGKNIDLHYLACRTNDHVEFEYNVSEKRVETGPTGASNFEKVADIYLSAVVSGGVEERKVIRGHSEAGFNKSNFQERNALTPEQVNRIEHNKNRAIERLARSNAEKMFSENQQQVIYGIIRNQNKSGSCAYSDICTPEEEFQTMAEVSEGCFAPITDYPMGDVKISLTPAQSMRIEINRLDALKRLSMK